MNAEPEQAEATDELRAKSSAREIALSEEIIALRQDLDDATSSASYAAGVCAGLEMAAEAGAKAVMPQATDELRAKSIAREIAVVEEITALRQDLDNALSSGSYDAVKAAIRALISEAEEPKTRPADEAMRGVVEALSYLYTAARGLSFGVDWNNGTQAKLHGYRKMLLDHIPAAEAALAAAKAARLPGTEDRG